MVYEQGDAGKAISFQSVQVLQGRGIWGQQPPLLRGPEPWERRGRKNGREKGPAWDERQRDLMLHDKSAPPSYGRTHTSVWLQGLGGLWGPFQLCQGDI